jgi:hypothetical protein
VLALPLFSSRSDFSDLLHHHLPSYYSLISFQPSLSLSLRLCGGDDDCCCFSSRDELVIGLKNGYEKLFG